MFACSSVSEAERVQALIDRNATRHGKMDSVSKRHRVSSTASSHSFAYLQSMHHQSANVALT